jgi:outer membrane lipoprotein LolB
MTWRAFAFSTLAAGGVARRLRAGAGCGPRRCRTPRAANSCRPRASRRSARSARGGFVGRLAVSTDGRGGSGRIEWTQDGDDFDVRLLAPVTRQGWRLQRATARVRLEGLDGGPREGTDAEALLFEATAGACPSPTWRRGCAARAARVAGDGRIRDAGRLAAALGQSGWRVEYPAGRDVRCRCRRVQAEQGDARVRLAIESWSAVAVTRRSRATADRHPAGAPGRRRPSSTCSCRIVGRRPTATTGCRRSSSCSTGATPCHLRRARGREQPPGGARPTTGSEAGRRPGRARAELLRKAGQHRASADIIVEKLIPVGAASGRSVRLPLQPCQARRLWGRAPARIGSPISALRSAPDVPLFVRGRHRMGRGLGED